LTAHTGSLPRPAELRRLYVLRARGELVDAAFDLETVNVSLLNVY
jgi:methionine synthase II (cobalamin-independent)